MNVNLVFHGVFAFVLNDGSLDVLFPYFAPHQYLFGSWHAADPMRYFEPLPKGDVKIGGLKGCTGRRPDPDFPKDLVPTVHGLRERSNDVLFCALHLKEYPLAVHAFRAYDKPNELKPGGQPIKRFPFGGVHGTGLEPKAMAGPMVLRYQSESADAVEVQFRFREEAYRPLRFDRFLEADRNTLNLHFFSEGEKDIPGPKDPDRGPQVCIHYQEIWKRLTGLIAGLDIRLDQLWPFVTGHLKKLPANTGVPGLPKEQLADLDEIGQLLQDGADSLGGDIDDCNKAHIVVDNRRGS